MSDFEEKLNAILSDPDAMAQVMGLAQSLSAGGAFGGEDRGDAAAHAPREERARGMAEGLGGIGELFSSIDPKLVGKLLPLLGELGHENGDDRLQLLYALRPFLKPERRDKVERAARAAKLIHIGKKFLNTMGEPYV